MLANKVNCCWFPWKNELWLAFIKGSWFGYDSTAHEIGSTLSSGLQLSCSIRGVWLDAKISGRREPFNGHSQAFLDNGFRLLLFIWSSMHSIKVILYVKVWVCLIATIVVFIVTLTTFTIFHPHWIEREHKLSNWEHLSHHCGYVAATIAYQGLCRSQFRIVSLLRYVSGCCIYRLYFLFPQDTTCVTLQGVLSSSFADSGASWCSFWPMHTREIWHPAWSLQLIIRLPTR